MIKEEDYIPQVNRTAKLKRKFQFEDCWVYEFGTFTVVRKVGQRIGLRLNRKFKKLTAGELDKHFLLGAPDVGFHLPFNLDFNDISRFLRPAVFQEVQCAIDSGDVLWME